MNHLFVPYELAKQLKEKGFPQNEVIAYRFKSGKVAMDLELYNTNASNPLDPFLPAPLYQQVVDWFDTKGIYINAYRRPTEYFSYSIPCEDGSFHGAQPEVKYTTRISALTNAIEEALKLI